MPDQIGDYYTLNKLQPPADHCWKLQKITREFADGDAWQRIAQRADETVHPCVFFALNETAAQNLKGLLYTMSGTAGLTMICDGRSYDEILVIAVRNVRIQPLQRHSNTYDATGALIAGGVGGRLVMCEIMVGRSNQPPATP